MSRDLLDELDKACDKITSEILSLRNENHALRNRLNILTLDPLADKLRQDILKLENVVDVAKKIKVSFDCNFPAYHNDQLIMELFQALKDLDTPSGKCDPYYGVTVSESGTIHSDSCDVDPETLTWKKSIEKYGTAKICFECLTSIDSKRRRT